MNYLHFKLFSSQFPYIKIRLIDELGNQVDPRMIKTLDYLSRFQHLAVVNKVFQDMIEANKKGIIEVYQDKIIVKEN